ncbi:MAG TPA: hypothetical protein PK287_00160 [Tenuifilaceae bacterium]|nr:hypothetical protein [Bacteroidales bacterium]HOF90238.1 hypothetical protein [Tenuifilaceae bacterium]HPK77110.1 hypothetical protein [Tenuifilaceae bacterium]HRS45293.1 hypothetical protein [Tenuifilaceae bacterium]HRV11278.1 hypothetical protein [Tenuifilaceae bacterium]
MSFQYHKYPNYQSLTQMPKPMRIKKQFWIILAIVFIVFWILGVLRFDYGIAAILFKVLLFPFGFLLAIIENYCVSHYSMSHFLNDEFFGMFMFGIAVLCQAILINFIVNWIRKR